MEYAYSILDVKEIDDNADKVRVSGIASTPTPDRMDDVVEPKGAVFKTPMPFFLYHDDKRPVGNVVFAKADQLGLPFRAEIPKIKEPGIVQDRVNEAIHSLKYNLIRAVSIGFRPLKNGVERMESGGFHFKSWEWLELSLVGIPANSEALITAIKSLDAAYIRTASAPSVEGKLNNLRSPTFRPTASPVVSGKRVVTLSTFRGTRHGNSSRTNHRT